MYQIGWAQGNYNIAENKLAKNSMRSRSTQKRELVHAEEFLCRSPGLKHLSKDLCRQLRAERIEVITRTPFVRAYDERGRQKDEVKATKCDQPPWPTASLLATGSLQRRATKRRFTWSNKEPKISIFDWVC